MKTENKKFRLLTDDIIFWKAHTLYRIQYKKDVCDFISAGDLGGYLESIDNLSEEGDCMVIGDAKVWGNSTVSGNARVSGGAQIYNSNISDNARVFDYAEVSDTSIGGRTYFYKNKICSADS